MATCLGKRASAHRIVVAGTGPAGSVARVEPSEIFPCAATRVLLSRAVDYAGLFPPASLALGPALRAFAAYARGPEAWMLGRFVLPAGRLDEAAEFLPLFDKKHPLAVSVLGAKTDDAATFLDAVRGAAAGAERWRAEHGERAQADQLEIALPPNAEGATISEAAGAAQNAGLRPFFEAAPDDAGRVMPLLAAAEGTGFKLRTGGTTAAAFPSLEAVASVLELSATHGVPIKFTAGLHHPVRHHSEAVGTKMHGFLNVLGAAVFAHELRWPAGRLCDVLNDEQTECFCGDDRRFTWHSHGLPVERVEAQRKLVASFGSCSFDEPRDDLRAMGWL